jgi:hypothetical protein
MPQNPDIGRGRNPYPSYATATESSFHRSRQPLRPSWGGNAPRPYAAQPSLAFDRGADAGRGGGPSRVSHRTPPHLRPGYVDTDAIIARLLKPHPKLVTQADVKDAQRNGAAPGRRFADRCSPTLGRPVDVYRSAPQHHADVYCSATEARSEPEPERANDRPRYLAWSKAKLLREANVRRLVCEYKDPKYLANILLVNDHKFFEKLDEYQHLNIEQLLEEAKIERVSLSHHKYWDRDELLSELAEKLAQVAVEHHNDFFWVEQVAKRQPAQAQSSVYSNRPSGSHQVLKMTNKGQKLKDLALKNKGEFELAASTIVRFPSNVVTVSTAKENIVRSRRGKKENRQKSTESRSNMEQKNEMFKDKSSQHSDSSYFTGEENSFTSQSTSTTPFVGDDGDNDELPTDHSKERVNARRNSERDSLSKPVADKLRNEHAATMKHASTIEDKDEPVQKPSKKVKISPTEDVPAPVAKAPCAQQPSSSSFEHDQKFKNNATFGETKLQSKPANKTKDVAPKMCNLHEPHTTIKRESKAKKASPSQEDDSVSAPKPNEERRTSTINAEDDEGGDSDEVPTKPTTRGTKRKAERGLTPESDASSPNDDDSGSASSSEDNRPKKKIAVWRGPKVQRTTKEPKKLRGIPVSERVPGMAYKVYADGSLGLIKRSAAARKNFKTAESRYNYIK